MLQDLLSYSVIGLALFYTGKQVAAMFAGRDKRPEPGDCRIGCANCHLAATGRRTDPE